MKKLSKRTIERRYWEILRNDLRTNALKYLLSSIGKV
jgi:hypothetical protein